MTTKEEFIVGVKSFALLLTKLLPEDKRTEAIESIARAELYYRESQEALQEVIEISKRIEAERNAYRDKLVSMGVDVSSIRIASIE